VSGKSSTLPARMRSGHAKTKSLSELQWAEDLSQSSGARSQHRHKFGSADNFIAVGAGSGTVEHSTSGDLQRLGLGMSNCASLDRLAVYDQPPRKLSLQVCRQFLIIVCF